MKFRAQFLLLPSILAAMALFTQPLEASNDDFMHSMGSEYSACATAGFGLSRCMDKLADQSRNRAEDARRNGEQSESEAKRDVALARQLEADHVKLNDDLARIRSSPESDERKANAAAALLQRPYQTPKELQKAANNEGIRTYDDLLGKGERKVDELLGRAEKNIQKAGELQANAKKAEAAGTEMDRVGRVNSERLRAMHSVASTQDPAAVSRKSSAEGPEMHERPIEKSGLPAQASSSINPESKAAELARKYLESLDAKIAAARKAPGLRASLRDRLRKAMLAAQNRGDSASEKALAARIAQLDTQDRQDKEKNIANGSFESPSVAFSMNESESRKAIEELVGAISDTNGREPSSTTGADEESSLFDRISRSIRACEKRQCVEREQRL